MSALLIVIGARGLMFLFFLSSSNIFEYLTLFFSLINLCPFSSKVQNEVGVCSSIRALLIVIPAFLAILTGGLTLISFLGLSEEGWSINSILSGLTEVSMCLSDLYLVGYQAFVLIKICSVPPLQTFTYSIAFEPYSGFFGCSLSKMFEIINGATELSSCILVFVSSYFMSLCILFSSSRLSTLGEDPFELLSKWASGLLREFSVSSAILKLFLCLFFYMKNFVTLS